MKITKMEKYGCHLLSIAAKEPEEGSKLRGKCGESYSSMQSNVATSSPTLNYKSPRKFSIAKKAGN